jgi:ribosomal protein S19E (S16A)
MAKRLQVNFHKPGPTMVSEDGQPRPCARGVGWVNADTLQTLEKVGVPRTDEKGRLLPESVQRAKA